jgi:hypothetical protein
MVQDRTTKYFEESQHEEDRIQDELANIRNLLEKIIETQRVGRGIELVPTTSQKIQGCAQQVGYDPDDSTGELNFSHYTHHVAHG